MDALFDFINTNKWFTAIVLLITLVSAILSIIHFCIPKKDGQKTIVEKIIKVVNKTVHKFSPTAEDLFEYGEKAANKNNYDKAIKNFSQAIKLKPDYAEAYYSCGIIYNFKFQGYIYKAISDLSKAIELKPDYVEAYCLRGNMFSFLKDDYNAISDLSYAIVLEPNNADAYPLRGSIYHNRGDYDNAISDFSKAIELEPDHALGYLIRGNTYFKNENFGEAISDYSKSIELQPENFDAIWARGVVYDSIEKYDEAILDYSKAIELKPDECGYYNRGVAYFKKENYDKAIPDFTKTIELNPNECRGYYNRGVAYFKKENYDNAILDLSKAIELMPDNFDSIFAADAYQNLGFAYYKIGCYQSGVHLNTALAFFQKAIEIIPEDSNSYLSVGYVYLAMCSYNTDYFPNAVEYFKLAANMGNEEAKKWLDDNEKNIKKGAKKYN